MAQLHVLVLAVGPVEDLPLLPLLLSHVLAFGRVEIDQRLHQLARDLDGLLARPRDEHMGLLVLVLAEDGLGLVRALAAHLLNNGSASAKGQGSGSG